MKSHHSQHMRPNQAIVNWQLPQVIIQGNTHLLNFRLKVNPFQTNVAKLVEVEVPVDRVRLKVLRIIVVCVWNSFKNSPMSTLFE